MNSNWKWLRYCRLLVGIDGKNELALDLSLYRIHFVVKQASVRQPCEAHIKVYNVSRDVINRIQDPERFSGGKVGAVPKVRLEAGYEGDYAVIFQGDLYEKREGRESETDTYLMLAAAAGDRAHLYAVTNTSLPAGWTQKKVCDAVVTSMAKYGITNYDLPELPKKVFPRGKSIFRMSSSLFDEIAETNRWNWGYTNDSLLAFSTSDTGCKGRQAIVLNAKTGLLGRPTLTIDGLQCRALLDPRLDYGTIIQIDNASIQRDFQTWSPRDFLTNLGKSTEALSADGYYRVFSREHEGDTRGEVWETRLICEANDPTSPLAYRTNYQTTPNT